MPALRRYARMRDTRCICASADVDRVRSAVESARQRVAAESHELRRAMLR